MNRLKGFLIGVLILPGLFGFFLGAHRVGEYFFGAKYGDYFVMTILISLLLGALGVAYVIENEE